MRGTRGWRAPRLRHKPILAITIMSCIHTGCLYFLMHDFASCRRRRAMRRRGRRRLPPTRSSGARRRRVSLSDPATGAHARPRPGVLRRLGSPGQSQRGLAMRSGIARPALVADRRARGRGPRRARARPRRPAATTHLADPTTRPADTRELAGVAREHELAITDRDSDHDERASCSSCCGRLAEEQGRTTGVATRLQPHWGAGP